MTAMTEIITADTRPHSTTARVPSKDVLDRLTLTATGAADWLDIGPVTVSGSAWWACVRVPAGFRSGTGAARLVALLWKFSRARDAAADATVIPFRAPAEIRPGVWKKVSLVAMCRETATGPGWHISLAN